MTTRVTLKHTTLKGVAMSEGQAGGPDEGKESQPPQSDHPDEEPVGHEVSPWSPAGQKGASADQQDVPAGQEGAPEDQQGAPAPSAPAPSAPAPSAPVPSPPAPS